MPLLKGQDITIKFIVDGKVQATLGHITSFDETADIELIRDEFLGDTAETPDHVFKIWMLKVTAQLRDDQYEELNSKVVKSMRYLPGGSQKVDVLVLRRYPETGQVTKRSYINVKFGAWNFSTGSRTDRTVVDFECATAERTPA